MEDSIEVMEYLNSKYEVFIFSAAMEFPNSFQEKYREYFPFITGVYSVGVRKVTGDYLDRRLSKEFRYFSGKKLLFTTT